MNITDNNIKNIISYCVGKCMKILQHPKQIARPNTWNYVT